MQLVYYSLLYQYLANTIMDLEKYSCLQKTSECEPIMTESFIFQQKFTDLTLYHDRIYFQNTDGHAEIMFDFEMNFEILFLDDLPKGISFSTVDQQTYTFERQFWSRSRQWEVALLAHLKQKGFHKLFKPIKKIGKGNFASVYLAQDLRENRMVAIKAFVKETAFKNNGKKAMQNQIKLMRMFTHDNLIELYGVYQTENSVYFVMEYAEGITLESYMRNKQQITLEERRSIVSKILSGLEELACKGVVHRDIKPENIIVSKNTQMLKILDYGLATQIDEDQYIFVRCGTPGFVAPEILKIRDSEFVRLSTISDIFSVGAIFFQMIYGRPLFDSKDHSQILNLNRACKVKICEYSDCSFNEMDLLAKMLNTNPKLRINARQCLEHDYFEKQESYILKQRNRIINPQWKNCFYGDKLPPLKPMDREN